MKTEAVVIPAAPVRMLSRWRQKHNAAAKDRGRNDDLITFRNLSAFKDIDYCEKMNYNISDIVL